MLRILNTAKGKLRIRLPMLILIRVDKLRTNNPFSVECHQKRWDNACLTDFHGFLYQVRQDHT